MTVNRLSLSKIEQLEIQCTEINGVMSANQREPVANSMEKNSSSTNSVEYLPNEATTFNSCQAKMVVN